MTDDTKGVRLTPEEEAEMKARPMQSNVAVDYTNEQLALRQAIAKKFCQFFLDNDSSLKPEMKTIYEANPMWKFYRGKDKDGGAIKRSYGVAMSMEGKPVLHTACCMFGWTNLTLGGTVAEELSGHEKWTDAEVTRIKMNPTPGIFLDPMGFYILLMENVKASTFC